MRSVLRSFAHRPWLTSAVLVVILGVAAGSILWVTSDSKATATATPYRLVSVTTGTIR